MNSKKFYKLEDNTLDIYASDGSGRVNGLLNIGEKLYYLDAEKGEFGVSRTGTISAARVSKGGMEPVILLSCYAPWESYHSIDGRDDIYSVRGTVYLSLTLTA